MADRYVVDTTVLVRWYLDQVGYERAREIQDALLAGTISCTAPDIARWELTNVLLVKGVRRGRIAPSDLERVPSQIEALGVVLVATDRPFVEESARLATMSGGSLFDAAFVVQAIREGSTLVTADVEQARIAAAFVSTELLGGVGTGGVAP